jgi:hypothetical protein
MRLPLLSLVPRLHLTGELTLTENERSASQRNENCNAIG